jgi:lipoprotein-releasing system ATP-binding protein
MKTGIQCRNLSVAFKTANGTKRVILDKINATFLPGQINLVFGNTGAGKSTLLNTLSGLIRPNSGDVTVDDETVSRWIGSHRDRWRRQVGIIFQHYHLLHDYTVLENVMLPLIPLGYSLSECRRRSTEILQKVALFHRAGSRVHTLSGGERQKTAMARALVTRPLFVFADEPTAHQDPENARRMMDLLYGCAAGDAVVVIATHEKNLEAGPGVPIRYRLENGTLQTYKP